MCRRGRQGLHLGTVWRGLAFLTECLTGTVHPGWLTGEHYSLMPKPQQMATFRSVISLSSTAGHAIHFSTIKGQRSLCSAAVPPLQRESRRRGWERAQPEQQCLPGSRRCPGRRQAAVCILAPNAQLRFMGVSSEPCCEELHGTCPLP